MITFFCEITCKSNSSTLSGVSIRCACLTSYAGFGLLWRLLSKWLVELRTRMSEEGESREAGRDVVTSGRQRSLIAKDRRNQIPNMSLVICLGSFLDAKPSHPALTTYFRAEHPSPTFPFILSTNRDGII